MRNGNLQERRCYLALLGKKKRTRRQKSQHPLHFGEKKSVEVKGESCSWSRISGSVNSLCQQSEIPRRNKGSAGERRGPPLRGDARTVIREEKRAAIAISARGKADLRYIVAFAEKKSEPDKREKVCEELLKNQRQAERLEKKTNKVRVYHLLLLKRREFCEGKGGSLSVLRTVFRQPSVVTFTWIRLFRTKGRVGKEKTATRRIEKNTKRTRGPTGELSTRRRKELVLPR